MKHIFVSYRRDDAAHEAGRLYDRLALEFGEDRVFRDQDSTAPGTDFVAGIPEMLARCGVIVAVIGPDWLDARKDGTRRLDDPQDWVRAEIAEAFRLRIPVVPVLVRGAQLPPADELPNDIEPLATRQDFPLTERQWGRGARELLAAVRRRLRPSVLESPAAILVACLVVSALAGFLLMAWFKSNPPQTEGGFVVQATVYGAGLSLALVCVLIAAGLNRWTIPLTLLGAIAIGGLSNAPMGKIAIQDSGDYAFVYGVGFGLSALAALLPTNSWAYVAAGTALGIVGGGIAAQLDPSTSLLYGAATFAIAGTSTGIAIVIAAVARRREVAYSIE